MKRLWVSLASLVLLGFALTSVVGQGPGNPTCPTRPPSDDSNACASTAFVQSRVASAVASAVATPLNAAAGVTNTGAAYSLDTAYVPTYANCALRVFVSASRLNVSLKNASGSTPTGTSPCILNFRSATESVGSVIPVAVTSDVTFATGASGSTFGASNNVAFRLWVTAWWTGSSVAIGLSNQSAVTAIFPLNSSILSSSTACSACTNANQAGVFYTTAAQTSRPIQILGHIDWENGLPSVGVWSSGPTRIQPFTSNIPLPGAVVKTVMSSTGTTSSRNSAVWGDLSPAFKITLTPTSAVNTVRVRLVASVTINAAATVETSLYRQFTPTQVGFVSQFIAPSANTTVPIILYGMDRPATTIGVTYGFQGRATSGTVNLPLSAPFTGAQTLVMDAEEIQN